MRGGRPGSRRSEQPAPLEGPHHDGRFCVVPLPPPLHTPVAEHWSRAVCPATTVTVGLTLTSGAPGLPWTLSTLTSTCASAIPRAF